MSSGLAVGPVVHVAPPVRPPADEAPAHDVESAREQLSNILATIAAGLEHRASTASSARDMLIAAAHIAKDPALLKAATGFIAQGHGPATAVDKAAEQFISQFTALGGYFAERVSDVRDIADRAIAAILGAPEPGVPSLHEPSIVVALDLAPSQTVMLDRALVAGIVTARGGRTSHTAILASQWAIPAVAQVPEILDVPTGSIVAIDGNRGTVVVSPEPEIIESHARASSAAALALTQVGGPGVTRDGHPVALLANIGGIGDAQEAATYDLEGVGLFRTEFVFLTSATAPTVAEQVAIYSQILKPFAGKSVVVRTLDAGADKPLAFADLGPEDNPALGRRGMRLSQARPELLDSQLEALAAAASDSGAHVKVMAPMVATAPEAQWFEERARTAGLPSVGVMVEVPAAALRAQDVLAHVDFVSIGTNDLAQYTMAADRMLGELADLLDPWQPAVLDLVAMTARAGLDTGKSVGVCGESAGDPLMALVLTGLGVSSLSMAPSKVAAVRFALSHHSLEQCREMAKVALRAPSAAAARDAVAALLEPQSTEVLGAL